MVIVIIIGYPLVIIPTFIIMGLHSYFGWFKVSPFKYVVPLGNEVPQFRNNKELRECIWRYINNNPDQYIHISKWNISHIRDMSNLCYDMIKTTRQNDALDGIEEWDMTHVYTTFAMFKHCYEFNQPIGKWKLTNTRRISEMFHCCDLFREKQSLDDWETTLGQNLSCVECFDVYGFPRGGDSTLPRWLILQRRRYQDRLDEEERKRPRTLAERVAIASRSSVPFVPRSDPDDY